MLIDRAARRRLAAIYPRVGPWTRAALWHGRLRIPPPTSALEAEVGEIIAQRLAGLLLDYVREHDVALPAQLVTILRRYTFAWRALSDAVIRSAEEVVTDLGGAGIECAVTKGPAIAAAYPRAEFRPFSDVDLLVRPDQFRAAVARLQAQGWREDQRSTPPREYFVWRCREGINLRRAAGQSIDVHHRVPPWLWTTSLDVTDMLTRIVPVHRSGAILPCVSTEDNLLVAALHVVSDRNHAGRSLIVWRDICELAAVADPQRVARIASANGLGGWLHAVVSALPADVVPQELTAALSGAQDMTASLRLMALLSDRSDRAGVTATQFLRLPLPNAVAFAAGMLVPSRRFLAWKFAGARHPYLTWLRVRGRPELPS